MTKTHTRRTPAQVIADLEAKIEAVKARAATREAKAAPEGKLFLAAIKAIDKALEMATDEKMIRALEAARAPLSAHMVEMGIRLPDPKAKRARRGKETQAA